MGVLQRVLKSDITAHGSVKKFFFENISVESLK